MKKILIKIIVLLITLLTIDNVKALETSFEQDFKGFAIDTRKEINQNEIIGSDLIAGLSSSDDGNTYFKISSQIVETEGNYAEEKILYCADGNKGSPVYDGISDSVPFSDCYIRKGANSNDKSIAFVYEKGYGRYLTDYNATEYLTGDWKKDYYITQAAIWYFTTPSEWMNKFDFTKQTYNGQTNEVIKKISKLITDAQAASNGAKLEINSSGVKFNLSSDGKYYISDAITIGGKFINSKISATLSGVNNAFITTNKDATSGTSSFNNNSTIYIKIPVESINDSTKLTLNISATTSIEESETIECSHQTVEEYQPIIIFYPKNTTLTESSSFNINYFSVKITKKNITETEELKGATLSIKNKSGDVIETWVSEETAKTIKLLPGTYTLEETMAPEGYIKSTNTIEFTVDDTGNVSVGGKQVDEIVITNAPITLTISKRSITGSEELEGATLRITDKDGNIVKDIFGNNLEWKSGKQAKKINLKMGNYILSEVSAPEGYELSDKVIEFTVDGEGKILIKGKEVKNNLIIFENEPEPKPVPTGSATIYIICITGLASLGTILYFVLRRKKLTSI